MSTGEPTEERALVSRHLRVGLWGLVVFVAAGAGLEALHAFKAPSYLDAGRETTRLMLRLAHAHGALIALLHVVFGLVAAARPAAASRFTSACLVAALVLLPGGFFLGGLFARGGDPGLGVVLVPAGALALLLGVGAAARRIV